MKTFLAIYTGSAQSHARSDWDALDEGERNRRIKVGFDAWVAWGERHKDAIVAQGGPLGKTKRTDTSGVSDTVNALTGYVIVRAPTHEAAARLFEGHTHFMIFPGESVEIMECLPLPQIS